MGNLFSHHQKNTRAKITDADRAVLSLKAQRKKLEDQTKLLEARIDQNVAVARELLAAKKRERALVALKKKKLNENQVKTIQAWLLNVEDMLSNMEVTKQQAAVFAALKSGNEALKQAQAEMSLDDVQQLMDDSAEAKEYLDKVQDVLGQQLDDTDTEAVMNEFAAMEAAALDEELDKMPAVPTAAAAAATAATGETQPAAAAEAEAAGVAGDREEEELPAVPTTKVEVAEARAVAKAAEEEVKPERKLEEPLAAS